MGRWRRLAALGTFIALPAVALSGYSAFHRPPRTIAGFRLANGTSAPQLPAGAEPDSVARQSAARWRPAGATLTGSRGAAAPTPAGSRMPPAEPGPARTPSATALLAGAAPFVPTGWSATSTSLTYGGLPRVYLTIAPRAWRVRSSADRLPLVVLLHGRYMTPDSILAVSRLPERIGPAVIVVPAGFQESWNAGGCCGGSYRYGADDIGFVHTVVEQVLASHPEADPARVYAVGFSNGGRLVYRLACDLPGLFRGVMAVEAVPVQACSSMRPLDFTVVAQQRDPLVSISAAERPKKVGGVAEPSVEATLDHLRAIEHCAASPVSVTSGAAVERTWTCAGGTHLRYVLYSGGAHTWRPAAPGTPGTSEFAAELLSAH